jgi:hypothetical protein
MVFEQMTIPPSGEKDKFGTGKSGYVWSQYRNDPMNYDLIKRPPLYTLIWVR